MTDPSQNEPATPQGPVREAIPGGDDSETATRRAETTPMALVQVELARLEAEVEQRSGALRALRPFAKPEAYVDLDKLGTRLHKLEESLGGGRAELCRLEPLLAELRAYQESAGRLRRKEVGRALKAACEGAGLSLRVISREDPIEVRIPPLAIVLDFDKGVADIRFARQSLRKCGASAAEILEGHRKALASLETAFDAAAFFQDCLTAYNMSLAALGRRRGDRVEINDFLATLALRRQSKKFLVDPVTSHFRSYSRAQFAYDVLRLRREGGLTQGGRRINFGVATGTTASKKSRVLYMEDGEGKGEYKLTIYFTESAG